MAHSGQRNNGRLNHAIPHAQDARHTVGTLSGAATLYNARPGMADDTPQRPVSNPKGSVAEWFKAAVLKTADGVTHP